MQEHTVNDRFDFKSKEHRKIRSIRLTDPKRDLLFEEMFVKLAVSE
jgi:hypothetical protein